MRDHPPAPFAFRMTLSAHTDVSPVAHNPTENFLYKKQQQEMELEKILRVGREASVDATIAKPGAEGGAGAEGEEEYEEEEEEEADEEPLPAPDTTDPIVPPSKEALPFLPIPKPEASKESIATSEGDDDEVRALKAQYKQAMEEQGAREAGSAKWGAGANKKEFASLEDEYTSDLMSFLATHTGGRMNIKKTQLTLTSTSS